MKKRTFDFYAKKAALLFFAFPGALLAVIFYVLAVGIRTGILRQKSSTYGKALADIAAASIPWTSGAAWILSLALVLLYVWPGFLN